MTADEKNEPRKRGSKTRRRISYAIAIVVSLAIAFVVYTKSRFLPNRVSEYVNLHYLADSPFEFRCGRISGDFVNRVVIEDPVLRYHSDRASFNVFRADEISIDYRLLDVLKFNLIVDDLQAHNVRLQIRQDEAGALVLPVPAGGVEAAAPSSGAKVDVKSFAIDGLQVLFGGDGRELAVRDVNLSGSFALENSVGRLQVDQGSAFLANTGTSVSSVRLDVEHEEGAIRVNEFVARLDQSFIMATGGYKDGRFDRLQLVFNPISLDEVHLLGLIPDIHGEFGGNVVFEGPVDSLGVSGTLSGTGLGIALGAMSFEGAVTSEAIDLRRVDGDIFGTHVRGAFSYKRAGDHNFVFDGDCEDLDITQGFVPGRGLPATRLDGHLRLDYLAAASAYRVDASFDSSVVGGYRSKATRLRGSWSPRSGLDVRECRMERPGYTLDVTGSVRPGDVADLLFRVDGSDLSYFWEYTGLPTIEGGVAVSGRAVGALDDLQINLNGDAYNVRYLFAAIDTARVQADLRGIGGRAPSARVDIAGRRIVVGGRRFERPHLRIDAGGVSTAIRDVSFSHGDTTFTADLDVARDAEGEIGVDVRYAAVENPQDTWRLARPSRLRLTPGELQVDSLEFTSAAGRVGVSGEYSESRKVVDLEGWGANVDLAVVGDALGAPIRLEGRGSFRVQAHGDVDRPLVDLTARLGAGCVDSLAFDRLELDAGFDGKEYHVDRLRVVDGRDSLDARGWWRPGVSPLRLASSDVDWGERLSAPFRVELEPHGYTIAALARALHRSLPLGGAIEGSIIFTGSPRSPSVDVATTITPRPGFAWTLPRSQVDAAYTDGVLEISSVELHGDIEATVAGKVPLVLSLAEGVRVDRTAPLALEVHIRQSDAAAHLGGYWSRLTALDGTFHGDVTVRGTIAEPRFGGELSMDAAEFQVVGMIERFTDADARVTFVDNVVRLSAFDARSDRGGTVHASGSVALGGWKPKTYGIDLVVRDLWLHSVPDLEALFDGELAVSSLEWRDGRRISNVTGKLSVKEATLTHVLDSGPSTHRASITLPTSEPAWICSIDIDAPKNVWIRDPDLRMELGGQLILKRDETGMYLRGDLNVLRGQYTVYGNKFNIIDGTLNFSTALLRPEIQINAYTPHRSQGGFERRIYLSLSWPHDKKEPTVTLSYDEPGYYESDIWRMLGGSDIAGGIATNTLERVLNEQMSDVSIEIGTQDTRRASQQGTPEQEMMIGVGKYLWQDVYLRYRQGLTLTTSREVEVEYRLSNMFLIRSELIRHARRSYVGLDRQTLDEFNLDVRLRWEF
jgi:hypothetical protein